MTAAIHVCIRVPAAACRELEHDRGDGQVTITQCAHDPVDGGYIDRDILIWAAAALAVRLCVVGLLFLFVVLW